MELITALYFHFHTPYGFREINFSKTLRRDTTLSASCDDKFLNEKDFSKLLQAKLYGAFIVYPVHILTQLQFSSNNGSFNLCNLISVDVELIHSLHLVSPRSVLHVPSKQVSSTFLTSYIVLIRFVSCRMCHIATQ